MKIIVYDMVEFEKQLLCEIQSNSTDEITICEDSLSIDTIEYAKGYDAISVIGYSHVNKEVLDKMKEYGIYHLSTRTIGYDHIDVKYAKEIGIHIYNAKYDPNNVADFTVMMMLIMLRKAKISICRALVNDFSLDGLQGREIRSLTIGIIGTGKIGSTVIKNLSGFGCKILAYDLYENESVKQYATYVDLDTIYKECDIISLHVPLTKDNYHMINKESLYKMKKGVILINTARGQLIDTRDLIEALEDEHVGGAGIDALEEESGVMHEHIGTKIINERYLLYLKQFPNVVYTQHYAFYTQEATKSMTTCGITSLQNGYKLGKSDCEVTRGF